MTALPGPCAVIDGTGYLDGVPIRPADDERYWDAVCRIAKQHGHAARDKRDAWEREQMPTFLREAMEAGL